MVTLLLIISFISHLVCLIAFKFFKQEVIHAFYLEHVLRVAELKEQEALSGKTIGTVAALFWYERMVEQHKKGFVQPRHRNLNIVGTAFIVVHCIFQLIIIHVYLTP
jgi:hypothetical protein